MFLNDKLESEEKFEGEFDEESIKKSNEEFDNKFDDKSHKKFDEKSDDKPDDKSKQNNKTRVDLTATYNTIHNKKKLVKILNGKVIVLKQR